KGKRDRTQAELEQTVALSGVQVVVALRHGGGDELDLTGIEAEALIGCEHLRLDCPVIGQEYALRAALDDGRRDRTVGDVGQRLGRECNGDVLLAQRLQPFADSRGEQRMV